jgi:DNA-binding NarL/FixJ family response regulator
MSRFRILIADDHEVVRQGLRALLASRPGWEVCGEAADGWEVVKKSAELRPDVIAMDVAMPNLNGLDAARQILTNDPRQKILFLTIYDSEQVAQKAMEAGARGVLLKSDAGRELITALDALQHNSFYVSDRLKKANANGVPPRAHGKEVLTPRERQVVQLLAEGKSTKEVATLLNLSVKTAETHRSNIMGKLGLHSISEVVLYAVRNNIVQAVNAPTALSGQLTEPHGSAAQHATNLAE